MTITHMFIVVTRECVHLVNLVHRLQQDVHV